MKFYNSKDIRNVAVLGHGGCGKTLLAEAMAYKTKLIDRMGRVEEKNTVSDYDPEEQARAISIGMTLLPLEYNGVKINLMDTPGYFDFVGEQLSALRVADSAIIVIDAMSGVEVGTEKAWEMVQAAKIPAMFVINKLDRENVDFEKACKSLTDLVGTKAVVFTAPVDEGVGFDKIYDVINNVTYQYDKTVAKNIDTPDGVEQKNAVHKDAVIEAAASASEELMEKYLEGEALTAAELNSGIVAAVLAEEMVPVLAASTLSAAGVDKILDTIVNVMPSPLAAHREKYDENKPACAFIFKTIADPYVGKLSLFKVIDGMIVPGQELNNPDSERKEKVNHIYTMAGKKQIELEKLPVGDIGAFSKLTDSVTNNILCVEVPQELPVKIDFPKPNISMAITPKSKGDEDKLSNGIARIKEEDPTVVFVRNAETNQNLVYGIGEMHIDVVASKLKSKFGVAVELEAPLVPYRETIKKKAADVEGKHKKQSGGSGQFGVVVIDFEPSFNMDEQLEFVDQVVGGTVPRQFIPAVEKGLRQCVPEGILAGYPVVGLRATLKDGKYHPVDSDEISFVQAARIAYREGMPKAGPVLLEPIYKITVVVPDKYMGDIMGDMSKKRGKIMGSEQEKGGYTRINAEAPYSEMFKYATELRSMTQGRGSFEMEFARYEEVPAAFSEKIIADAKARKEAK